VKTLLIVSFYFPPIMSAGSVRIGKFAKYLPEFGWNPVVLTVQPKKMTTGIPLEIETWRVVRTPYRDPVGFFSRPPEFRGGLGPTLQSLESGKKSYVREWVKRHSPFTIQRMPDRMLGWYPYAVKAGRKVFEWNGIDAVFSSHPTPASHLVAARLCKKAGVPWVADYRDLWTGSTLRPYPGCLEAVERRFERKVLKGAAALTTVSETLRDYLDDLHGKPVEVIYNGFDPEDFQGDPAAGIPGVFTVVYSGTLYTSRQSPASFFRALESLMGRGVVTEKNFRARFIGVQEPPFNDLVVDYGLASIVTSEPFQPYRENVATLKGADVLLFFSWNAGEMAGNPTSKIFQYAGAGRPILVVGDENRFVSNFVKENRAGEVGRGPDEIAGILERWLARARRGETPALPPDKERLARFDRRNQAKQLAEILDRVAA